MMVYHTKGEVESQVITPMNKKLIPKRPAATNRAI